MKLSQSVKLVLATWVSILHLKIVSNQLKKENKYLSTPYLKRLKRSLVCLLVTVLTIIIYFHFLSHYIVCLLIVKLWTADILIFKVNMTLRNASKVESIGIVIGGRGVSIWLLTVTAIGSSASSSLCCRAWTIIYLIVVRNLSI